MMEVVTVDVASESSWLEELNTAEMAKLELKEDPVALACACYRLWKQDPTIHSRFDDFNLVTTNATDYQMSAEIRKYYADRILVGMLTSNNNTSEFRKKLYGVVTNSLQLNKKDIGLLYKLPYFYLEDTAVDRVVAQTVDAALVDHLPHRRDNVTAEFTVIETVSKIQRPGDYVQFWMHSDQDSAAYMMTIKTDNPYRRLLSQVLERPVKLTGTAHRKVYRGHHRARSYYYLADIALA